MKNKNVFPVKQVTVGNVASEFPPRGSKVALLWFQVWHKRTFLFFSRWRKIDDSRSNNFVSRFNSDDDVTSSSPLLLLLLYLFYSNNRPLFFVELFLFSIPGSARWARSIFSSYCPLSPQPLINLRNRDNYVLWIFFGMLGIKPGAAGSGSKYGNHCAFLPLLLVYFP